MQPVFDVLDSVGVLLNTGIAGSEFTPLKLLIVISLIILFERPIKIGDRIEIAGVVGEVREIAARATTLVTDENVAIVVPNSQFISERVTNWSRPGRLTAYALSFHVSHRRIRNWSAAYASRPLPRIPTCCPSRHLRWSLPKWGWRPSDFNSRCGTRNT